MVALGSVKQQDLVIPQRGKFELTVQVTGAPQTWSGWTAKMQIRPNKGSPVLLDEFTNLDAISFATGQVQVDIPGADTALYTWDAAMYDLVVTGPTTGLGPYRILEGVVTIDHS